MKSNGAWLLFSGFLVGLASGAALTGAISNSASADSNKTVASGSAPKIVSPAVTPPSATAPGDLSAILKETDSYQQAKDLAAYADTLRVEDIPAAIRAAQAVAGTLGESTPAITALVNRWVALDPPGVLAWLNSKENPTWKVTTQMGRNGMMSMTNTLVPAVYGQLAARDPDAVIAAIGQMPKGEKRDMAADAVFRKLAEKDPVRAMEFSRGIGHVQGWANFEVFTKWGQKDPAAATAAATSLPSAELRKEMIDAIAGGYALKDPKGALAWAEQLPDSAARANARQVVIGQWAYTAPQTAIAWADGLTNPTEKKTVRAKVMENWMQTDPVGAAAYVKNLPAGKDRDEATKGLIQRLFNGDQQEAIAMLQAIPPGALRDQTLASVGISWGRNDPEGAVAYGANLPAGKAKTDFLVEVGRQWFSKSGCRPTPPPAPPLSRNRRCPRTRRPSFCRRRTRENPSAPHRIKAIAESPPL